MFLPPNTYVIIMFAKVSRGKWPYFSSVPWGLWQRQNRCSMNAETFHPESPNTWRLTCTVSSGLHWERLHLGIIPRLLLAAEFLSLTELMRVGGVRLLSEQSWGVPFMLGLVFECLRSLAKTLKPHVSPCLLWCSNHHLFFTQEMSSLWSPLNLFLLLRAAPVP